MQAIASSLRHVNAIVCGPGILQTPETCEFLRSVIAYCATGQIPLLLDADALNILSVDNTALNCLRQLASPKILTPHAGELARLLAASYSASLQELACELGAIIVAKGAQTQIAGPVLSTSLGVVINAKSAAQAGGEAGGKTGREAGRETSGEAGRETGNSEQILTLAPGTPALAKAGSGDVLSGIIGSLLAQGMSAREAAIAGVQLHGQAAHLAEQTHGRRSVIPEDLIAALPAAIKQYEERVESQIV
jgi:NAD(P)H-hydrate repair Nnr-like enzyme with NAD(P)H-hydrate dehydratase domain